MYDLVQVLQDVSIDGYEITKGSVGTIVSIYDEAFAVEFPDLEPIPAVVTLRAELIGGLNGN